MSAAPLLDASCAILGRAGSGKTTTAKGFVEGLLGAGRHVAIIDPTGVWYGLRSNATGDGPGFGLPVFGGLHGDVPIRAGDGAKVARLIVDTPLSAIVDVSELASGAEQRAFMLGFTAELRTKPRTLFHLVIDEADEFAPQTAQDDVGYALLETMIWIAKRGRVRGFVPLLITQRPADIAKAVLSQMATLIVHQLIAPTDQAPIAAYLKSHATREQAADVMKSLAGLGPGERWVYSPEAGVLTRGRSPRPATFDTSATPAPGDAPAVPATLAAVDVGALVAALAPPSAVAEVVAPADAAGAHEAGAAAGELLIARDATIAKLSADVGKLTIANAEVADLFVDYLDRETRVGALLEEALAVLRTPIGNAIAGVAGTPERESADVVGERVGGAAPAVHRADRAPRGGQEGDQRRHPRRLRRGEGDGVRHEDDAVDHPPAGDGEGSAAGGGSAARDVQGGAGPDGLNGAAEKLVALLDRIKPATLSIAQAAQLIGYKASGGYFRTGLRQLQGDARVTLLAGERITAQWVGSRPAGLTRDEALALWRDVLPAPASAIINELNDGPLAIGRVATLLGYKATGGYFRTGLRALKDAGVVVDRTGELALVAPLPGESA